MAQEGVIRNFMVALGFQTDNSGLGQMQDAMKGVELKAVALKGALLALATGAVAAVRQTASELDKLYFSSQRIGASANNINAYGNAIAQLGGNAEGAIGSLESLAEKIRNSPGYESQIKSLGVDTRNANGEMRDRVEVMKDLSGVLSQMPAYQANAYANSLGIDQNTLLAMRDGKFMANMEKYQNIQKELGMNDDLAKSGNEFMTEYRDLTMMTKTGFQVIVMQAGKALIPVLRLLNQLIMAGISAFSQLNPEIKQMLGVGLRFGMLILVFGGFIKAFGMVFKFIPMIKSFIGVLKLFRLAFLASPIGIILALASALALLWDDYKTWKEGGKSLFDWSKWTNGIDKIISKIKDFLAMLNKIKDNVINFVQKIVSDPVEAIKDVVDTAKNGLNELADPKPNEDRDTPPPNNLAVGIDKAFGWVDQGLASLGNKDAQIRVEQRERGEIGYSKTETPKDKKALAKFAETAPQPNTAQPIKSPTQPNQTSFTNKIENITQKGVDAVVSVATMAQNVVKESANINSDIHEELGTVSAKYEGKIGSANKDVDQNGKPAGWAYGKFQFNSAKGGLATFFKDNPQIAKHFEGLRPGTDSFNKKWKELAKSDPVGFEKAQNKSAAKIWFEPAKQAYAKSGFNLKNRGVQEAIFSSSIQHGGVVKYLLPKIKRQVGKDISLLSPQEQIRAIYKGRTAYHERGRKRYEAEMKDALKLSNSWTREIPVNTGANSIKTNGVIKNFSPPSGNPDKSHINNVNSRMSASKVTIHQEFKTDMTINGAKEPIESANAVKRQQENSMTVMARNAKAILV
ncbi:phage tail tape measure protein [Acinetobacter sp. WCHAc060033]|uniref:phage tail tape measure protein n=1 Tax=Acinetobacter sp. WCHAc060033 TaxID=2518624 RepID=UPI001D1871B6|nr:phage tail tape measure protein [Acinetobacter sp. WCHAc060033]